MARKRGIIDRIASRFGFARVAARSFYAGAASNRLNLDWVMGPSSADDEVKADLRKLRDRARSLRRDNPWAARYVALQVDGILGAHGVKMQCRVGNSRGGTNSAASTRVEAAFADWAANYADAGQRHSFAEHERLLVETWKTEGEHFVQLVPVPLDRNPYGFALQAIDADQVDESYNVARSARTPEVRMGVELDAVGAPVAYHVWSQHPSESGANRVRQRIPASQMIHIGRATRPGQTRYLTPYAPVMQHLRHLEGLQEAVLVLQRTAACKMGFISVDPQFAEGMLPKDGEAAVAWDAEPGRIEQLPVGMQFSNWDPGQPGAEYDPFTKNVLRGVASGLGVSYASLTGDLSAANYGSQRVGMTAERDGYKSDQQFMIRRFHARVYAAWLEWAFLSDAPLLAGLPVGTAARYPADWQPRGFDWIDPETDIKATLLEVGAGLDCLTDVAARKGRNFAENIAKRAKEEQIAAAASVTITLNPKANANDAPDASAGAASGGDDRAGRDGALRLARGL